MLNEFPIPDEAIGLPVIITGGLLDGRTGVIDALADDPRSRSVVVSLDPDGSNVWLDVDDLQERQAK
jgi:hypothetical protein